MRMLDQKQPYAEVHGMLGAMYEQDGVYFKGNGEEASSTSHIMDEVKIKDSDDPLPYIFCIEQSSESPESIKTEEPQGRDLENMHWRHLKALVEVYGETWENKEKAIAFLKGKA